MCHKKSKAIHKDLETQLRQIRQYENRKREKEEEKTP